MYFGCGAIESELISPRTWHCLVMCSRPSSITWPVASPITSTSQQWKQHPLLHFSNTMHIFVGERDNIEICHVDIVPLRSLISDISTKHNHPNNILPETFFRWLLEKCVVSAGPLRKIVFYWWIYDQIGLHSGWKHLVLESFLNNFHLSPILNTWYRPFDKNLTSQRRLSSVREKMTESLLEGFTSSYYHTRFLSLHFLNKIPSCSMS